MAIINCPECGKEISDQAVACPSCGFEINSRRENKTSRTLLVVLLVILAVAAALATVLVVKQKQKQAALDTYYNNFADTVTMIAESAEEVEESGILINNVWHNAIWEESDSTTDEYTKDANGYFYSDFNDALNKLFSDEDFIKGISKISDDKNEIVKAMSSLKNPPEEYEDAYYTITVLYKNYASFADLVINPKGSLESFTEEFKKYDAAIVKDFEALLILADYEEEK